MITNPVIVGVLVMIILCLLRFNIMLAIVSAAIVAGTVAGLPLFGDGGTLPVFVNGMSGNLETALSYILLGVLAYAIAKTGLTHILSSKLEKVFGKNGKIFLLILAFIACFSQNLVPIHIAFIPILIPALLPMMNDLKIDRRAAACALTYGLEMPYVFIPAGFGFIYHGIISKAMTDNGVAFATADVWRVMLLPAIGMTVGLLVAIFISYRKPREYVTVTLEENDIDIVSETMNKSQWGALLGAVTAFTVQLVVINSGTSDTTGALPLGALAGILVMLAFGSIKYNKMDKSVQGGIKMMGFIAFIMLTASGFASVLRATGGIEELIATSSTFLGDSKFLAASVMLLIGLIITMGIGTSFGTIPIIATIYVPLGLYFQFSPEAIALLVGVAGALGDAGSPASDSTLGPTSGLNADGLHSHINDTCIPTFLHYNIPLLVFGVVGALLI